MHKYCGTVCDSNYSKLLLDDELLIFYPVGKVLAIVIMARKLTGQVATSACKIYRSYGTVHSCE